MLTKTVPRNATRENNGKMAHSGFHKLFLEQVKDIYWVEKSLVKALPRMKKAATSEELADAIDRHLEETHDQVDRLEQIFEQLDKKATAKKCAAMAGILEEVDEMIAETENDSRVRDAALIMAAQKVEHYEIATYGSLRALAKQMGEGEIEDLLGQTLEEEKNADSTLSRFALNTINQAAAAE